MTIRIRPDPATLAEIRPVLERAEDLAQLVALGELRGFHHVEQPVREDLLDGRRVIVEQDPDDALADPPRDALDRLRLVQGRKRSLGRGRGQVVEPFVEQAGGLVELGLVDRTRLVEGHDRLLDGALAEHEDEARHPLVHGDEVDPSDVSGAWLGRGRDAG
jgi:hypothetical protein